MQSNYVRITQNTKMNCMIFLKIFFTRPAAKNHNHFNFIVIFFLSNLRAIFYSRGFFFIFSILWKYFFYSLALCKKCSLKKNFYFSYYKCFSVFQKTMQALITFAIQSYDSESYILKLIICLLISLITYSHFLHDHLLRIII